MIAGVKADVEQGSTFADALGKHPKVFNELYVNLVRAGEVGGILDTILKRLAQYMEKADALKRKVKGAMVYPATIMVVSIGVITLLLVKVIPVFKKMFKEMGGALPAPTQMVIDLSALHAGVDRGDPGRDSVATRVRLLLGARARSREFRYRTDALFLKLPIFGSLLRKVAVARFSRTLGTMISSGVPILDALDICARTAGNLVIEAALVKTRAAISEGKHHRRAARGVGRVPRHGGADDRGRRSDRRAWIRCSARSPTSTTTRSTPRWRRSPRCSSR